MDVLKKVEEYEQVNKKARKLEEELSENLWKQFIDLPFKMQKIEIQESSAWRIKEVKEVKGVWQNVYYPELDVPEGYKKEEKYVKLLENGIKHQYTLKDKEGRKIIILENATYDNCIIHTIKGRIEVPFSIAGKRITYEISISNTKYTFKRDFEYTDMFLIISGKEEEKAKYNIHLNTYSEINKKYEEFLLALGLSKETTSLGDIVNSKCGEIMLGRELKAEIKISCTDYYMGTWFKNQFWSVYINRMTYYEICVELRLFSIGGLSLREDKFTWYELKNKSHRKGITLQEAIKLIKEK